MFIKEKLIFMESRIDGIKGKIHKIHILQETFKIIESEVNKIMESFNQKMEVKFKRK